MRGCVGKPRTAVGTLTAKRILLPSIPDLPRRATSIDVLLFVGHVAVEFRSDRGTLDGGYTLRHAKTKLLAGAGGGSYSPLLHGLPFAWEGGGGAFQCLSTRVVLQGQKGLYKYKLFSFAGRCAICPRLGLQQPLFHLCDTSLLRSITMASTISVVTAGALGLVSLYLVRWLVAKPSLPLPPGPPALPLIGNAHQLPKTLAWKQFAAWGKQYGPIYHLSVPIGLHVMVLTTDKAAHELLAKRGASFSDRPKMFVSDYVTFYQIRQMLGR